MTLSVALAQEEKVSAVGRDDRAELELRTVDLGAELNGLGPRFSIVPEAHPEVGFALEDKIASVGRDEGSALFGRSIFIDIVSPLC